MKINNTDIPNWAKNTVSKTGKEQVRVVQGSLKNKQQKQKYEALCVSLMCCPLTRLSHDKNMRCLPMAGL